MPGVFKVNASAMGVIVSWVLANCKNYTFFFIVDGRINVRFVQFNDVIFTNKTGLVEVPTSLCGDAVFKHGCLQCCVKSSACNIVYIAYKAGSKLVERCTLYHLDEVELIYTTNLTLIPEFWIEMWTQNGLQPAKTELAIFGKDMQLLGFLVWKISKWPPSSSTSAQK